MSDPFIGQISLIGFGFAPYGWSDCNGQTVPFTQFQALAAVLNFAFGGNTTQFNLPNLCGRAAVGAGQTTPFSQAAGTPQVTLQPNTSPRHTHAITCLPTAPTTPPVDINPAAGLLTSGNKQYAPAAGATMVQLNPAIVQPVGSSLPHSNFQPSLPMRYIIATQGVFPVRA